MKKTLNLSICCFLTLLIGNRSFAQTILLQLDGQHHPYITVDGQKANQKFPNPLNLIRGADIKIKLVNPDSIPVIVTIKSDNEVIPGTAGHVNLTGIQNVFKTLNPIATDNQLVLAINGTSCDLSTPFDITFAINGNRATAIVYTFVPTYSVQAAVPVNNNAINAVQQTSGTTASGSAKGTAVYIPGSAVYDALKLSVSTNVTEAELKAIIQYYFPKSRIESVADVDTAASKNPFLKSEIKADYTKKLKSSSLGSAQSAQSVLSGLSMSSIGGLDVTAITDGLAKLLVKRAKQELSTAFFSKLVTAINSQPDLITLFPKTANMLGTLNGQSVNYSAYLPNLQKAFKNDIAVIDTTLPGIIRNHQTYFDRNPKLKAAIIDGSFIMKSIKDQDHPGDIIEKFPVSPLQAIDPNWSGAIQTLQLLSESLRDTASTDDNYWVNIKYLRQLINNKTAFKIYLGLVYQEAINDFSNVSFGGANSLITALDKVAVVYDTDVSYFNSYKLYILTLSEKTGALDNMIKAYKKPASDSVAVEQYAKYFNAAIDLIQFAVNVKTLPSISVALPGITNLDAEFDKYLALMRSVSDLAVDVTRKDYSSAINQTVLIINKLNLQTELDQELALAKTALTDAKDLLKRSPSPANTSAVAAANTALAKAQFAAVFIVDLNKYGSFLAAVAVAKNDDQIEAALEAFVLPAGSSSVKRESPFNVALNAYTGLFYGHEKIQGITSYPYFNSYGLTAPIGVSFGWGQRKLFDPFSGGGHTSFSFFVSLIDIGAVAAYRFKDDTTSQVPKIQLKNIFSPGLFLSIGLPKTPLSINFGAQTGPSLRQIDNNGTTPSADISDKLYWRYSVSLVVDIPLMNLYTKSK